MQLALRHITPRLHVTYASVVQCVARRREPVPGNQSNTLCRVFAPCFCHSGQTRRFRRCSSAAVGALEYPKKNSRNGNKEEL